MAYKKRFDGRKFDELREMEAKVGIIKNATGSAYFKIGNTIAYAAVYGPRDLFPRFLKNPKKGLLRCNYNMMAFSGMGERVRPGPSRRSREISLVTENALSPVVNLEDFPNSVVDVYVELTQTDAGSRCAGICAASMALADAGIMMKDLVSAVSVGVVDGQICLDLNYDEEAYDKGDVADIPVAFIPSMDKFSLLQMDGKVKVEDLMKALDIVKKGTLQILEVQRKALKAKFGVMKNE
jgi:exosome complex component RRP41